MDRFTRIRHFPLALLLSFSLAAIALGDLGPPVEIRMPRDTAPAASGTEFTAAFEVEVFQAGTISEIEISGPGWKLHADHAVDQLVRTEPGVLRIPFRAIPADADAPITLKLRFNGRIARQAYEVGPRYFAQRGQPRALQLIPGTSGARPDATDGGGPRGGSLIARGRIVYQRPGLDMTGDGDTDDPEDIPSATVGADAIRVRIIDNDPIGSDEMWSGFTDEFGYFETPALDADVDGDGSGPDLILRVEAFRSGWVDVTDNSLTEDTYVWQTPEVPDYAGNVYDYGWITPLNASERAALHIYSTVIRARRFIDERGGYLTPEVQVEWPTDEWSHYQPGPREIHLFTDHTWSEDTIVHEYGHHFIRTTYTTPDPDYDNGICDEGSPEGDCFPDGGTWSPGPGHCGWCEETDHDAWNEGWPNWLADIVLREYPTRYTLSPGGPPFFAVFRRSYESLRTCCVDGTSHDALLTEGFVAALLRDIEDAGGDDEDGDGIRDQMCAPPSAIFDVVFNHHPITVLDFLSGFRAEFPALTDRLWPTARNVGGSAYVSGFPADTQPPGIVTVCDSPTHPLGTGGALPCVAIEWEPAEDDVRGATDYSYTISFSPGGEEPDTAADPVQATANCRLSAQVGVAALGSFYFSIRARDAAGNWSPQWTTFGPFVVIDCNGSGFLDICDIRCCDTSCSAGPPGICNVGSAICPPGSCAASSDCNGNFVPDECDLAQGTSQDCNRDGIPDECQENIIRHFSGESVSVDGVGDWEVPQNWLEGAPPIDGQHVCIPSGTPATTVSFSEDFLRVSTLNCNIDFRIDGPSADLRIDQPSYVSGDLQLLAGSTLRTMTSLDVAGELVWQGRDIYGPGTLNVYGGFDLSTPAVRPALRGSAHLSILDGDVNIHGDEYFELYDSSSFSIGAPVTYSYDGNFHIFNGGPTTVVNVAGQLIRASGDNNASINSFVLNTGLIHNRSGDLTLRYGSTQSGFLLGDPGTLLRLGSGSSAAHSFQSSSVIVADDITFDTAATTITGGLNITGDLVVTQGGVCNVTSSADVASYGARVTVVTGSAQLSAPTDDPVVAFESATIGEVNQAGQTELRLNTGRPVSVDSLLLRKGDIQGADSITVNNAFTWGTGGGQIAPGGAITSNGLVTIQGNASSRSLNRLFNNNATALFLGAFGGSGTFNNAASATMELRGDSTGIVSGVVNNAGTIIKTLGTGISNLNRINNTGVIRAQVGEIAFSGAGGFTSTNNGTIVGDPGTLLRFNNIHEMTPASTLTADNVRFFNASINIRGAVHIAGTLTLDGGICTFTNEADATSYGQHLLVRTGTIRFEAPTSGPVLAFDTATVGDLTAEGGKVAHFSSGQPVSIDALNLVKGNIDGVDPITINDSFVWGTGGGSINAGGAITILGPATIQAMSSNRNLFRPMNNAGYMTFSGGFGGGSGGAFTNLPAGTMELRNSGTTVGMGTNATLTNNGLLLKTAGATSSLFNHFRNTGTVDLRTGVLQLAGTNAITNIQTAGQTLLSGGTLAITAPGVYDIQGGDLAGVGTVTGNITNSGGVVKPGLPVGTMTISAAYAQHATAALHIEIGGAAPGLFDVLQIGGPAALSGELNIQTVNGFTPAAGNTFVVLTASARSGTFSSVTGSIGFDIAYTPTQVILTATGASLPADLDGDCDVDLSDLSAMLSNFGTAGGATREMGDIDGDGDVDLTDLSTLLSQFGSTC